MKNKIISINKIATLVLFSLTLFSSCGDDHNFTPYAESVPTANANVKFLHTAIGPAGVNFSVNWFLNDVKSSALLVITGLPLGTPYGSAFPTSFYTSVPSGNLNMKAEIPATATVAASTVLTSPLVVEAGKNYSTFLIGAAAPYAVYTVTDDLTVADPTKAYIRFLNVISNTPATGYDLSIKELNSNAVIFSGVIYLGGNKAFIPITPVADDSSVAYEAQLRTPGTTTIVSKVAITPRKGRIYTFYSGGYVGGLPATKNLPVLGWYTNK